MSWNPIFGATPWRYAGAPDLWVSPHRDPRLRAFLADDPGVRRDLEPAVLVVLLRVLPEAPDVLVVVLGEEGELALQELATLMSWSHRATFFTLSISLVKSVTVVIT